MADLQTLLHYRHKSNRTHNRHIQRHILILKFFTTNPNV